MLFTNLGQSMQGKTVPRVLSTLTQAPGHSPSPHGPPGWKIKYIYRYSRDQRAQTMCGSKRST